MAWLTSELHPSRTGIWPHSPWGVAPLKGCCTVGKTLRVFVTVFQAGSKNFSKQHSKQHSYIKDIIYILHTDHVLSRVFNTDWTSPCPKKQTKGRSNQHIKTRHNGSTLVPTFLCLYPLYHVISFRKICTTAHVFSISSFKEMCIAPINQPSSKNSSWNFPTSTQISSQWSFFCNYPPVN